MALRVFVDVNGWAWDPAPDVDDAEAAVVAIAAGEWREEATATWLRQHLRAPQ